MADKVSDLPDGRPTAPPETEAQPRPKKLNGANGHHLNGKKRALICYVDLQTVPNAPVALIDDPTALEAAGALIPMSWLPVAFDTAWTEVDWSPLISRRPVIVPANDPPGAKHAARLETYLRSIGIQATILALPDALPAGWRMADGLPGGVELFRAPSAPYLEPLGDMFSAEDLLSRDFPPVQWIIEGWLPTGLTLLVGPPKRGKSWLAMDFACEIPSGRPVLGHLNTTQCSVLYVALEDPPRRLKDRLSKMLGSNTLADGIVFATQWPRMDSGGLEKLAGHLDAFPETRLVILDTLAKVRGKPDRGAGVYEQDYQDIGQLQKFANDRNIALIVIHHTRKQDASDALDAISGSNAIAGAADTIMVLRGPRGDPLAKLTITGRDIVEDGEFAVKFDKETAKWSLLGPAAQVKAETEQQRVYDLLLHSDEPVKPADIATELGIAIATVRSALHRLKRRGAVMALKHAMWGIPGRDYKKAAPRGDD